MLRAYRRSHEEPSACAPSLRGVTPKREAIPDFLARKPLTGRRAAQIIVVVTTLVTVMGGVAIRIVDSDEFSDIGTSLWWALQTLTPVGYGDVVPHDTAGRIIGAILMLQGLAFITITVAGVTAMLIDQLRQRRGRGTETDIVKRLQRIEEKLDALEREHG